jgi:hypothetical protein
MLTSTGSVSVAPINSEPVPERKAVEGNLKLETFYG